MSFHLDFTHPATRTVARYLLSMTKPSGAIRKHAAAQITQELARLQALRASQPAPSPDCPEFRHLAAVEAWSGGDLDRAGRALAEEARPMLVRFGFVEKKNPGNPSTPAAAMLTPAGAFKLTLALTGAKDPFIADAMNGSSEE